MSDEIEAKRVRWHSRRGMLELDVLLIPFAEEAFTGLSPEDQLRYRQLLECEDPDLFTWFMEHQVPDNTGLARIIELVREHARNR